MEMFRQASLVRLRSHHDKYLLADVDEESVSQKRDSDGPRAKWRVEFVAGSNVIRLKSCFSKYLTASDEPQCLRVAGKKVIQTLPRKPDSSTEWEPIREGVQVKLRSRYGYFLRANGGLRPWRNLISHNIPRRSATKNWILWEVDVLERREVHVKPESIVLQPWSNPISRSTSSASELYVSAYPSPIITPRISLELSPNISPRISPELSPNMSPRIPLELWPNRSPRISPQQQSPNMSPRMPPQQISPNLSSRMFSTKMSSRMFQCHQLDLVSWRKVKEGWIGSPVPVKSEGRLIWFKVAGENFAEMDETLPEGGSSFHFKGTEVEELKLKLAEETGLDDEGFIICSRNPFNGRLYPLKLDLPPNHATMNLFVVPLSSEVAKEIASWNSPRAF